MPGAEATNVVALNPGGSLPTSAFKPTATRVLASPYMLARKKSDAGETIRVWPASLNNTQGVDTFCGVSKIGGAKFSCRCESECSPAGTSVKSGNAGDAVTGLVPTTFQVNSNARDLPG